MAQPLQPRRSERNREPLRSFADEQAYHRFQQEAAAEVQRALRQAAATIEGSDSEEEELSSGEVSGSDDDEMTQPDRENIPQWIQQLRDIRPPVCTAQPTSVLPRHCTPTQLGFLQCFLDPALIDTFVTNTNLYALAHETTPWVPVTSEEMWRYLAIRIRQGIVVLPELHHYWEAGYRDSYIAGLMPRNRFMQLHRYFHIAPPVDRGQRQNVVQKTAPFYHQCQRLFKEYYIPGSNFTIDETMIRFQGRSYWITIIKAKPEPMGYKIYTVASDGYLLGFRIFRGKGGYDTAQNVLHHVVMDLVREWGGVHRTMYFDNLYTSPALCDDLLRIGIRSCGTCRASRKDLPPNIKSHKTSLPKGERMAWQRGQLGCLLWNDARPVLFLTTHLRPDRNTPLTPSPGRPAISRPTVAVDYNHNKGHVDQVDQLRSYHVVQRRGRRTWPALAWWLLDMCIVNAHKLWDLQHSRKTEILDFREELLKQIAAAYPSPRTPVQPTVPAVIHSGSVGHWPRRSAERRNCAQCNGRRTHRLRTTFQCEVCQVYLHPHKCMKAYHERHDIDNRTL
jgi:hypothetical protein